MGANLGGQPAEDEYNLRMSGAMEDVFFAPCCCSRRGRPSQEETQEEAQPEAAPASQDCLLAAQGARQGAGAEDRGRRAACLCCFPPRCTRPRPTLVLHCGEASSNISMMRWMPALNETCAPGRCWRSNGADTVAAQFSAVANASLQLLKSPWEACSLAKPLAIGGANANYEGFVRRDPTRHLMG